MSAPEDTYVLLRAFADELARCGMRAACTSPGSRNAPLVLTLAAESRLRCHSHIDERSAGFFALGLAKASGLPVAVTCTSGTAAAELLPAAIEAQQARVPLLLLTADRPPELRDSGAGQTIDQLKLFGSAVKWFFEVGVYDAAPERVRFMRALACRAYWTALQGPAGPVHLNFPLREPLTIDAELPPSRGGRADGAPWVRRTADVLELPSVPERLRELAAAARRGVVVAGREERERRPEPAREGVPTSAGEAAAALGAAACWPVLADPLSRGRRGVAAIAHYDLLLREPAAYARLRPDLVVRVGDLPTSKPLRSWLAGLPDVAQVALDPDGAWQDPAYVLRESLALDPVPVLERLAAGGECQAQDGWLAAWRDADERAAAAIRGVLETSALSEPLVAAELGALLPASTTLFVASSMPVRDVEAFWPVRDDPPRVLCNRGANGIDGTVSAAFGAAAAGRGPVVLLCGDVALAHDLGGLLAARRLDLSLTIVVLANGGGSIFDFLPLSCAPAARTAERFERHIATPPELDFATAAELFGLRHRRVHELSDFRATLLQELSAEGAAIVEVPGTRSANLTLHQRLWSAAAGALSQPAAAAAPPA